jgi:hypothetical protein
MQARPFLTASAALALALAGCGGSSSKPAAVGANAPEVNPPGDIPDNQAFVAFAPPGAGFTIKVPEGWARTTKGGATLFEGNLNSVRLESRAATTATSAAQVRRTVVPRLRATVPGFRAGTVTTVSRPAGRAVRITYGATAAANAVTGRRTATDVELYLFFHAGHEARITLSGPKGADNVDPWRTITTSLRWTR